MKKCNTCKSYFHQRKFFTRILMVMKVTVLILLSAISSAFATSTYSQNTRFSLHLDKATIQQVFNEIQKKSEFIIFYKDDQLDPSHVSNVDVVEGTVDQILDQALKSTNLGYKIIDRQIVIIADQAKEVPSTTMSEINVEQKKEISGLVKDSQGLALPGVSVVVKGTTTGTITDANGKFAIKIPTDAQSLIFSFIGMRTQEIAIGTKSVINLTMEVDKISVDEVVVTALGIVKSKKSLTYSTQEVNMESLTTIKDISLGNALAGKVAGVSVTSSTGTTGVSGDPRIIIRGDRSINGNNQPLIVVDGNPYSSSGGGLSSINPDDVLSMNVLKGPAASALYGSSANNGVIVVTTKKGIKGQTKVEVNSVSTFDLPYLYPKLQNVYAQGLDGIFQPNSDVYSWGPKMTGQTVTDWTGKSTTLTPQPNNVKDFFKTGYNLTNSFSYSTGSDKSTAYFSYSNTTAKGVLEDNKMQRHNFNLRLTTELLKNLNLDFKITWFNQNLKDRPTTGDDLFSPMHQLIRMPRSLRTSDISTYAYYTPAGDYKQNTWIPQSTNVINPYWSMYGYESPSTNSNINSLLTLKYNFTKWLYLQLRGGMAVGNSDNETKVYWDTQYVNSGKGSYQTGFSKGRGVNSDFLLVFDKDLNKDFHLNFNLGGEIRDSQGRSMNSQTGQLSTQNKFALNYAVTLTTTDSESRTQKQSVYGMGQLAFRNYLYLDVTSRQDWSSTLPAPYKYFYPSIGLTGIISDMVKLPDAISFVKLRGHYAEVGNDAGFAQIFQTYSRSSNGPAGMVSPSGTKVPVNLIPEKTKSWEGGADIRFFKNRLGIDFTLYKSNTYNQLITITTPATSGYSSGRINCGNIRNTGVEFMIFGSPIKTTDFTWDIDLNFSKNTNKVIELSKTLNKYPISSPNLSVGETWAIVGLPFGEVFTKGFIRNPDGKVIVDSNGNPKVDTKANLELGNFNYDWRSGMTNNLRYKNWNLSFLIDLNYGGVRQSATEAMMMACGTSEASLVGRETGIVYDGVQEIVAGDGTKSYVANTKSISAQAYAQLVGGRISFGAGEPFNHAATNCRLREFSIGYTIPLKSQVVKSLRVSAMGRNIFYIYNACKWFDPDVTYDTSTNGQGAESAFLPGSRTLGFNIKLTL